MFYTSADGKTPLLKKGDMWYEENRECRKGHAFVISILL